jgi:D-alanyl-D-alanine carboxypeptidase
MAASAATATGLAIAPRAIGAQATPSASPVATTALPAEHADAIRAAIVATMEENGIPGAAVHLGLPGYEPFVEAFGIADKATDEPVTLDTHFRIGSITKTFVGTVILQLVDEGQLSLDHTIDGWDIEVPNADRITLRHLLSMTSGLQNFSETPEFAAAMNADPTQHMEPEEVVALASGDPHSEPGETFYYNNTNFTILGIVAENVTGQPLDELLKTRVFDVVGMSNTGLALDAMVPEPFARGYGDINVEIPDDPTAAATPIATPVAPVATPDPDAYQTDQDGHYDATEFNPSWAWAAGSAWSTVGDLALWVPALLTGATLSPDLLEERLDMAPMVPDRPELGGYGLAIADLGGLIGHNGQLAGYSSIAVAEPEFGLTAVVLTNLYPGTTMMMTPDVQILNAAVEAAMPLLMG